jgi:group II intron reverse transcriptase/maturase
MQSANTLLTIIRDRGKRGLPLERVYRMLFNPDLYLRAYAKLYPNKGALTPGTTAETADGMSLTKIEQLIDDLRHERYRWAPVRRTYIAKKNSTKKRPLGIPTWRDKLLQEVIRSILEAYFEPQFNPHSHGFRPERGCHTALRQLQTQWSGTRWFIEGDIASYFDTIDHDILLSILGENLHDNRFLRLIGELLQAGYLEDWRWHATLSGTPQGSVCSPILANIFLDRLDRYVETVLIPAYTRGKTRAKNPAYVHIQQRMWSQRRRGNRREAKILRKQLQQLPSIDPYDRHYRRLRYIRYADDFLIGFSGPRQEAETIKRDLKEFLQTRLKLELSEAKTLITHASTQPARFLGYDIVSQQANHQHDQSGRRSVNGTIGLRLPRNLVQQKRQRYLRHDKPKVRAELLGNHDFSIVAQYQQEYRGLVQYYLLASDVSRLWSLEWTMRQSLLKTLAAKHQTSVNSIVERCQTITTTPEGKQLKCFEVRIERQDKPALVARFGGISLTRQPWAVINERPYIPTWSGRTELLQRLLADTCELCGAREEIEVHHIRKLADLKSRRGRTRPLWMQRMATRQRKTLVVCRTCHQAIHYGQPTRQEVTIQATGERSALKGARSVRRGADGKGAT